MEYSIGQFSKITNISIYTLRYYEKENLIISHRRENGRRYYIDQDINWIKFIKRLKDTNMHIKEIRKYCYLRAVGDSTMNERMKILLKHRVNLQKEIDELNEHLNKLNKKINFYQTEIMKTYKDKKSIGE